MSYRLEVWDRKNERRRAVFGTLYQAERRQVLQAEEALIAEVAVQDGAVSALTSGAVLRLQREGVADDFTLWRLTGREQVREQDGRLVMRVTADALWMDFRRGTVRQKLADGRFQYGFGLEALTPEEWLEDFIVPAYEGSAIGFEVGAVEPDDPVDLAFDHTTPLEALRMLEAAVPWGAEAQFRLAPDGETYVVDLLHQVGAEQGTAELRYAKNVQGLTRLEDEADVETRVRASGDGLLTLADAEWLIAGVSGGVVSFEGPHPVFEDGAFVGLYLHVDGDDYPVIGSDSDGGTITVDTSGLPNLSAGDVAYIATDEGRLDYLESPEGVESYGVLTGSFTAEDVPDAINAVVNPDLSEWSGGLPVAWSKVGSPDVSREDDRTFVRHGKYAARVEASQDGEGLVTDRFELENPVDRPYTAILAGLTLLDGRVRLELRDADGTRYPISERPTLVEQGVYSEMSAGPVHDEPLPEGEYELAIVAHGDGAEFVLDTGMVTPTIGEGAPTFVAGSGAHVLWERAAAELADRRLPRLEYSVDVIDLYRVDPDHFRFDELRLGDVVKLRDPDFPRESVRIVELTTDVLRAEATQVALADSARRRITDPFLPPPPPLGGRKPGAGQRPGVSDVPEVLHIPRQWDGDTKTLTLGALGNPNVATLELRTRSSTSAAWQLVDTITGRQGWFEPIVDPDERLLIQVTPRDGRGVPGEPVEDTWIRGEGGPQGPPGDGSPSVHLYRDGVTAGGEARYRVEAETAYETTDDLVWRRRYYWADGGETGWPTLEPMPDGGATFTVQPDAGRHMQVEVQVRDTVADRGTIVSAILPAAPPAPPVVSIHPDGRNSVGEAVYRIEATTAYGATDGLRWRWRIYYADGGETGWQSYDPMPDGEATLTREPDEKRALQIEVQVEDVDADMRTIAGAVLPAEPPDPHPVVRLYPDPDTLTGSGNVTYIVEAEKGFGGTGDLVWRRRYYYAGGGEVGWPSLEPMPGGQASFDVPVHKSKPIQVEVQVRDTVEDLGTIVTTILPSERVVDDDGNYEGGRGVTGGGTGRFQEVAYTLGAVRTAIESGGRNLLPSGSGAVVDVPTDGTRYPGRSSQTRDQSLSSLGLSVGRTVSLTAVGRRTGADGVARLGVGWIDDEGEAIRYDTVDRAATTDAIMHIADVEIPSGTVAARIFYGHRNGQSGGARMRSATLTPGPIPQMPTNTPAGASAQNLMPAGAGERVDVPTGLTRYAGRSGAERDIPLSQLSLRPGDVVSYSAVGRVTASGGLARTGVGWVDSSGDVVDYTNAPDYEGTSERWLVREGLVVPDYAVAVRQFYGERGTGTARFHSAMLHKGERAIPFEEPPWRPGRERDLPEGTGVRGGRASHRLVRGGEVVTVHGPITNPQNLPVGGYNVEFERAEYETPPMVALRGFNCRTTSESLSAGDTRLRIQASDLDTAGFTSVAQTAVVGAGDPETNSFPTNELTLEGHLISVTLDPGGARGGSYVVRYSIEVENLHASEIKGCSVAIDTDRGDGWVTRETAIHQALPRQTRSWPNQEMQINVSNLQQGGRVRLRIRSKDDVFAIVSAVAHDVSYVVGVDDVLSAVNEDGDFIEWVAQAIS